MAARPCPCLCPFELDISKLTLPLGFTLRFPLAQRHGPRRWLVVLIRVPIWRYSVGQESSRTGVRESPAHHAHARARSLCSPTSAGAPGPSCACLVRSDKPEMAGHKAEMAGGICEGRRRGLGEVHGPIGR